MGTRDDGQARRLNGLLEKRKFEEERRKVISESLRNGASKSKKIVFKDSDDEGVEVSSKRLTLFDEDDEPELTSQDPEQLLKNRFTGIKSQKLTEIESRFNYDQRFKVDDRFVEGSDDEIDKETGEKTVIAEKKEQFAILSSILGHEVKSSLKDKTNTKAEVVRPFQRFDPDNPEHVKWMEKQKEYIKVQNKPLIDAEAFNQELEKEETKVVEGHFYEIDRDFAKELHDNLTVKEDNQPFSFLSSIGRDTSSSKRQEKSIFEKLLHSQPDQTEPKLEKVTQLTNSTDDNFKPYFFVDPFDAMGKRVLNAFRRQQSMDKIKKTWQTHRDKTENYYKSMVKSQLRIREKEKKQNTRNQYKRKAEKNIQSKTE
ncbi:unnamed protein product [Bursaphelenchus okinawaensis]|uniref:Uncharacterized protein n=1 Tax=Bursaphelenchus okinawaensis TaxID=465554 RepID=A0A811KIB7_9BILA|nr:unnamed protein product [Bursaphelenchus okinawaensis]CAG9103538.1 unnamed protein product [Bursaphelenchus okinawaensis]